MATVVRTRYDIEMSHYLVATSYYVEAYEKREILHN